MEPGLHSNETYYTLKTKFGDKKSQLFKTYWWFFCFKDVWQSEESDYIFHFSDRVLKKQSILFMIKKTDTCVTILFKKLHVLSLTHVFTGHKSDQKVTCDLSAAKLNTKTAHPIHCLHIVLPHARSNSSDSTYWSTYGISDSWILILNNALTHFLFVKCPFIWVGEGLLHKFSQYGGMLLVEEYNFHPATQHQLPTFKLHKNATFKAVFPNYEQITRFTTSYRHKDYDAM